MVEHGTTQAALRQALRAAAIAASIGQPPLVVDADMIKLIGLPLAWIAVFVSVAFVVFRMRDL